MSETTSVIASALTKLGSYLMEMLHFDYALVIDNYHLKSSEIYVLMSEKPRCCRHTK